MYSTSVFSDVYAKKHKVYWESSSVSFSGIPFMIVAQKILDCHHGIDRNENFKKKYKETKEIKSVRLHVYNVLPI